MLTEEVTSMHISALPLVSQDVLFFGATDPRTGFLSPSCQGPIHLKQTANPQNFSS